VALFSVWSPGLPGRPSWSATSRIELSTLFLPCDSAEIVGIVILAHDSRRFAKDGAWFRVAGRYGFRLAGDSATNVPSRTGPQGRFFIARNPVSSRDFARFCRCHARPKPVRSPPTYRWASTLAAGAPRHVLRLAIVALEFPNRAKDLRLAFTQRIGELFSPSR
jgi:hypothetical protein